MRNEGTKGAGTAKFFGLLVAILTALNMACTLYYGITYWQQGAFKNSIPMMSMMEHGKMQEGGMMQGKGMMHGNMPGMDMHNEDKTNEEKTSPSDVSKQ